MFCCISGIWCRLHRTVNWSSGTVIPQTRYTRYPCVRPGWWRARTLRPAATWPVVAWTTFVQSTASRPGKETSESAGNCLDTPVTCRAADLLTIIKSSPVPVTCLGKKLLFCSQELIWIFLLEIFIIPLLKKFTHFFLDKKWNSTNFLLLKINTNICTIFHVFHWVEMILKCSRMSKTYFIKRKL